MIEQSPILITGCARSGTSLIARVVSMCGAFTGDTSGMNGNVVGGVVRRGMMENRRVQDHVVEPYLRSIGADTRGQYPLPVLDGLLVSTNWKKRVEDIMIEEGYMKGAWMLKDTKMCLIWPVWHYAYPNAKWLIVRRRTGDIIHSCVKTGFMKAFKDVALRNRLNIPDEETGWLGWVHEHEKRFVEMINEGLNCKIVWPHRMVHGDYEQLYEVLEWIGLSWKSDVLNFIDPLLWNSRQKEKTI